MKFWAHSTRAGHWKIDVSCVSPVVLSRSLQFHKVLLQMDLRRAVKMIENIRKIIWSSWPVYAAKKQPHWILPRHTCRASEGTERWQSRTFAMLRSANFTGHLILPIWNSIILAPSLVSLCAIEGEWHPAVVLENQFLNSRHLRTCFKKNYESCQASEKGQRKSPRRSGGVTDCWYWNCKNLFLPNQCNVKGLISLQTMSRHRQL